MTRPAKPTLSLAKIDLEEKVTDLRLRLRGKLAVDLVDYQRAYAQSNTQDIALEQLVPHILSTFMEGGSRLPCVAQGQPDQRGVVAFAPRRSTAPTYHGWPCEVLRPQSVDP
jgi:hypothetical protein